MDRYEEVLGPLALSELPARSVLASALLGSGSAGLRPSVLVRLAGIFGVTEGSARVSLSRMLAAGEVENVGGRYRPAGRILERRARQDASRWPLTRQWDGSWSMAVLRPGSRPQAERQALTTAMARLRMAR